MSQISKVPKKSYYRADGVRITHDPYSKGMAEKYGLPGETDNEGFDPYADSVGAGIYGGIVKRASNGVIEIGRQYQGHNPRPGPVYAGGGYTPINTALSSLPRLRQLLDSYPDLVNDVSTGGAQPLHMCGMSQRNQHATATLISRGGDIEALDTYGYTPLHRMASNNLAVGAAALLEAGADPSFTGGSGQTAAAVARESRALDVLKVLDSFSKENKAGKHVPILRIVLSNSEFKDINGEYTNMSADTVPEGFDKVCKEQGWDTGQMWKKLNRGRPWFSAANQAYIYFNSGDGHWWIDEPGGGGVYKAVGPAHAFPAVGWKLLAQPSGTSPPPPPSVQVYRKYTASSECAEQGQ